MTRGQPPLMSSCKQCRHTSFISVYSHEVAHEYKITGTIRINSFFSVYLIVTYLNAFS